MQKSPLGYQALVSHLDELLEVEFTFLHSQVLADRIVKLNRSEQEFILNWLGRITSTHIQIGYELILNALTHTEGEGRGIDRELIESWALHVMDTYDVSGLHPAMAQIRDIEIFFQSQRERSFGAPLDRHERVLRHVLHGLSGRELDIKRSEEPFSYTDTEVIYLPAMVAERDTPEENFLLYKALMVYQWAQARFGTFRYPLQRYAEASGYPERYLQLFAALDRWRLEGYIARELPGLYRSMQSLSDDVSQLSAEWRQLRQQLLQAREVESVISLVEQQLHRLEPLAPCCYQPQLHLDAVLRVQLERQPKEKARFKVGMDELVKELRPETIELPAIEQKIEEQSEHPDGFEIEITFDGSVIKLPQRQRQLLRSIVQDFGELPPDYLQPAGAGDYDPKWLFPDSEADSDAVWHGTYHLEGASLYDEWDHGRQHYRKNWCAVREKEVTPVDDEFIYLTRQKYSPLMKHLRKTFEAMRDEDRVLRKQESGDGIDFEALVEALADRARGEEMSDRLFTRMHRADRNIAVVFMVDMSGSTKGWINDAERESLLLLCEALESLNDRYAIYGFSGMTRLRCEIYTIKRFEEPFSREIEGRISAIRPQDYTRMGFAIRHLTQQLLEVEAKTRLLITLSDGKPDDYNDYRGEYGIEDTRRALIEARRNGIHPYCITIDQDARDYLPHLYGPAAYTVVSRVEQLPYKISDIYRRLTLA
ncbi:VWA domain-containing protein [Ectothiorhodospiraceae bacterium BW-2]|nr:VWA domain-containing protein [Ectothiorhodospiraceae bacterium BW-2]